ncbi:hypothetical protein FB45DRAFT_1024918 [Roridomyces roridus]|uniref:Uncharacterized protein n=1 Tax=Roridomyces roridus TaxID=1738132 RepID=A0AAD7C1W2_9AGAR|nr:hypothetical protein FB45DRAFT_1024918 [Roridomyces roridus]
MAELNEGSTPLVTNLNYEIKSPTFAMAELNEGSIPFKPRPIGFGRPPRPILYLRERRVSLATLLPKDDLEAHPSPPTPATTPIHHSPNAMDHWCEHCEFMPWPLNPFIPSFEPVIFDWVFAPAFSNTISSVGAFPTSSSADDQSRPSSPKSSNEGTDAESESDTDTDTESEECWEEERG